MNTDTLEKQYDALVAKSCDNKNRISNTNEHILKINDEIDDVKKEIKNICNVEIVTEKHYVDMYEREIDINTKLDDFFSKDQIIFYNNIEDLSYKINKYKKDTKERKRIAKNGNDFYLKEFNSTLVSEFILNKTFDIKSKKKFVWE